MNRYLQAQTQRKKYVCSELVSNGDFNSSVNWLIGGSWIISNGKATKNSSTDTTLVQNNQATYVLGKKYRVVIVIVDYVSGLLDRLRLGGSSFTTLNITANGTYNFIISPTVTGQNCGFYPTTFVGSIESISIKEIVP